MSTTITTEELRQAIAAGEVVVLEALPKPYFDKEHIPSAQNLPLDEIDELAPRLAADLDASVVTYCSNSACGNSAIAADRLEALGYNNVRKYAGGKQEWIEAGLPVESSAVAAGRYNASSATARRMP